MSKFLFKSASIVSLMIFVSRVLGFIRDIIASQLFGVNASVDAFYIAFRIPNFFRNLFAEGSFSQAFVPVLSDYRENRSPDEVRLFISHIAGALGVILLGLTVLGVFGSYQIIHLFSPGLDGERYQQAGLMLRITFPYLMLISFTAFVSSILNCYGKFGIASFTPALLNICLIATAFFMSHWFNVPVESQAWGVLMAGFAQLLFLLPTLYRIGFFVWPRVSWRDPGVKRILKLMLPALFGASAGQISLLFNSILASFLVTGSFAWLYYSERLAYFPLGVFGVALATVTLPHLSRQHASASKEGFSNALEWGLRCNMLVGVPAMITMLILSGPLIISLFDYGKFTPHDVVMTQKSVLAYGIGLPAFMLAKILSASFYAQQDIRTPVKTTIISLVANACFSLLFIGPLVHAGLALATSLGSWINVLLLITILYRRQIYRFQVGTLIFLSQLFFANAVITVYLWWMSAENSVWMHWSGLQRLYHLAFLGLSTILLYVVCLFISNMKLRVLMSSSSVS